MLTRPDNTLIIGKTGSGKTCKALALVEPCSRLVIFDTNGHDYCQGVVLYAIADLKRYWRRVYKGNFRIIYRPENELQEFQEVAELVYGCGNVTFIVEEADTFCQPQRISPAVWRVLKRGRHRDLRVIFVTQRPVGIDRTVTSQATSIIVFRTEEPRDLDYLEDRLGKAAVVKITQLKDYEYLLWQGASAPLEVCKDEYH